MIQKTRSLRRGRRFMAGAAATALIGASGQAFAQDAGAEALGDIVVVAQKREQKLQDVGLSVTAIGADDLAKRGIEGVEDLVKIVPGLAVTPSPYGTPVYTLRGVGFFESSISSTPDVAVYLDQAPLALPAFAALTAFDLERVEVLKGPQGTLFGTNATGGAINLIAAKPTRSPKGGVEVSYGRFNAKTVSAFLSGPITDTLSARIAVKLDRADDWQRSYTRNDSLGKTDSDAARLLLDWRPADRLHVMLNLNGWLNRSDPQAPQLARQTTPDDLQAKIGTPGLGGTVPADLGILFIPAAPRNARAANWIPEHRPYRDDRFYQVTGNIDYDLTDTIALTSLTSYSNLRQRKASALSGVDVDAVDQTANPANADDFSQEVRIAGSDSASPLRWVLGGTYERTFSYEASAFVYKDGSTGRYGFTGNSFDSRQRVRQWAAFGNVEYKMLPELTLKAGVRYSRSTRTAANRSFATPGYVEPRGDLGVPGATNVIFGSFYVPNVPACAGVVYSPITAGQSFSIDPVTCQSGTYRNKLTEDNVPWTVGIDYKVAPDVLVYANASRGFKGGAYPLTNASSQAQYAPVPQEELTSYEVGFKSRFANNRLIVNGAAFYYDYKNKQSRGKTVDPIFAQLEQLVSIPKSRVLGAELDITARPIDGLTLRVAGTWLDTEIKRYVGIVGSHLEGGFSVADTASFDGVRLPFAPKFASSASADYEFALANRLNAFIGGNLSFQSESYGSAQLDAQARRDATIKEYATLDVRAGFNDANDKWRVTFWGKNVTNSSYWTNSLRAYDTIVRYTARPAEYGTTFAYTF